MFLKNQNELEAINNINKPQFNVIHFTITQAQRVHKLHKPNHIRQFRYLVKTRIVIRPLGHCKAERAVVTNDTAHGTKLNPGHKLLTD